MENNTEYYPICIKYCKKDLFLLWFSNDIDGIIVEKDKILIFASVQEVLNYSKVKNIKVKIDDVTLYNFDKLIL